MTGDLQLIRDAALEAAALVTDHLGRPFAYNRPQPRLPSLLCASPGLHRLILRRVEPIDRPVRDR
jgi:myo-inositol-1(or 4)-monophosphatase